MAGIEASWVGKTPEEWHEMTTGEKEYTLKFTMTGEITIFGKDIEGAIENAKYLSNSNLLDYVDDVEFEQD